MQRWAYMTAMFGGDHGPITEKLRRMGDDGWELVSVLDSTTDNGDWEGYIGFFKKPAP